jgi:hypothetical protein
VALKAAVVVAIVLVAVVAMAANVMAVAADTVETAVAVAIVETAVVAEDVKVEVAMVAVEDVREAAATVVAIAKAVAAVVVSATSLVKPEKNAPAEKDANKKSPRNSRGFFCLIRQQLKITHLKSSFYNLTNYFCFAYSLAKPIFGMGIAMFINRGAIYKIGLSIDSYGQIATFPFQAKITFATRNLYNCWLRVRLCFLCLQR